MTELTLIKLCRLSPLHIGTGRDNFDTAASELHSDTLTAALAALKATREGGREIEQFMQSFALSSAFPFWKGHYFMPVPQGRIAVSVKGQQEHQYRKKLKKVRFADFEVWKLLAQGQTVEVDEKQLHGAYLLPQGSEGVTVSASQVMQRVSVPREGGDDPEPFFFEWRYFDPQAGLYCLTDAQGDTLREVISLFEELGQMGIGSDKNVGGGHFEVEQATLSYNAPVQANAQELLSLYIPTREEHAHLLDAPATYTLVQRGGFIAGSSDDRLRHLRKKTVYAFGVGSVFHTSQSLKGAVVDLQPAWNNDADGGAQMHPVWRSGRAFTLPIISTHDV